MASAGASAKQLVVTASPDLVDFGPSPVNRPNFKTVVFTNETSVVLHVRRAELTPGFGVSTDEDCTDLVPGGSCFIDYFAGSNVPGTYKTKVVQPFVWLDAGGAEHVLGVKLKFVVSVFVPQ